MPCGNTLGVAVVVRARCGSVYILIDDQNVVTLGIVVANADLSFNGLFRLSITTVPRVDHCDIFLWTQVCAGIAGMYNWGVFNFGKRAIKEQCKGRCVSYF